MRAGILRWGIVIFISLVIIGVGIFVFLKIYGANNVSISDSDHPAQVSIDFTKHANLLTQNQQIGVQSNLISRSTNPNIPKATIHGTIRPGSVTRPSPNDTEFIIDVPGIKTSFLISRYVSKKDTVDIMNILCVPSDKKIYSEDYCHGE